jgi:hypothetical protein
MKQLTWVSQLLCSLSGFQELFNLLNEFQEYWNKFFLTQRMKFNVVSNRNVMIDVYQVSFEKPTFQPCGKNKIYYPFGWLAACTV